MIVLDVAQGSPAWERARLGIATASEFHRIITPRKLQYATGARAYMRELLAEWVVGYALEAWVSPWAERGKKLEPEARRAYAFERGLDVEEVGFVFRDEERLTGCSPDGLVGEEGGLELKCPAAKTHIGYLLDPASLVDEYLLQIQGSLWVTGREWWDAMSYYPGLPPVLVRVAPDDAAQSALDEYMANFLAELAAARTKLLGMGIEPRLERVRETPPMWAPALSDGDPRETVTVPETGPDGMPF